ITFGREQDSNIKSQIPTSQNLLRCQLGLNSLAKAITMLTRSKREECWNLDCAVLMLRCNFEPGMPACGSWMVQQTQGLIWESDSIIASRLFGFLITLVHEWRPLICPSAIDFDSA